MEAAKEAPSSPEGAEAGGNSLGARRLSGFTGFMGLGGIPFFGARRGSAFAQDRWVCPNDRQLALRAKLKMGWSTSQTVPVNQDTLSAEETKIIMEVIQKAEEMDLGEQNRVGRLVEKVEVMKDRCLGNGTTTCVLCGAGLPLIRTSSLICSMCSKGVCSKCGVEAQVSARETLWICKICAETRELWKRSGAWFFHGLPKHVLPSSTKLNNGRRGRPPKRWNTLMSKGQTSSEDNDTSSDDEPFRKYRLHKSVSECVQNIGEAVSPTFHSGANRHAKPGVPPLTPDPSSYNLPRSRSVSPSPLRIDLAGTKDRLDPEDRAMDRSPISPGLSPRDFMRTPSRESAGGESGGLLTPRYSPSPSSLSPRNELKRDHAFDRSPSPLLRVAWRESGRSSNSSVSES